MKWDKIKNGLKRTGSILKKGAKAVYKEIESNERARNERISILSMLTKEQLKSISKDFDIDAHDLLEITMYDEKPSEPTRDDYISAIANRLGLDGIKTALISINADKRIFDKVREVEDSRRMRRGLTEKKFLEARDELKRAKEASDKGDWPEVLNHLRVAIDLAIKEKFGFTYINPMSKFIESARILNFPLPSYDGIFVYFDFGSKRLHDGLIHTPLEAESALTFVTNFINKLNSISIDENKLADFKCKCQYVR